jgi:hypothetical protein
MILNTFWMASGKQGSQNETSRGPLSLHARRGTSAVEIGRRLSSSNQRRRRRPLSQDTGPEATIR